MFKLFDSSFLKKQNIYIKLLLSTLLFLSLILFMWLSFVYTNSKILKNFTDVELSEICQSNGYLTSSAQIEFAENLQIRSNLVRSVVGVTVKNEQNKMNAEIIDLFFVGPTFDFESLSGTSSSYTFWGFVDGNCSLRIFEIL